MRKNILWDQATLDAAIEAWKGQSDIRKAEQAASEAIGWKVTANKLYLALRRNGICARPTELLRAHPEIEPIAASRTVVRPPKRKVNGKVLVLSDFHVPDVDTDAVQRALDADGDADEVVLAGDIFDFPTINNFGHEDRGVRTEECYLWAYNFSDTLRHEFKQVHLIDGNHDLRLKTILHKNIPYEVHFLVDAHLNVLGSIKHDMGADNVHYTWGDESWWCQLGDCVVAHPQHYSVVPGRTVRNTEKYFLREIGDELRGTVIGHTHGLWLDTSAGGPEGDPLRMRMETGCLSIRQGYSKRGKAYSIKHDLGYGVLHFDDSHLDVARSGFRTV